MKLGIWNGILNLIGGDQVGEPESGDAPLIRQGAEHANENQIEGGSR